MNVHPEKLHKAVTAADMLTARECSILVGRYIPDTKGNALALEFKTKDGLYGCITVPRDGGTLIPKAALGVLLPVGPLLAFLSKHPAVAPVTPIKVRLETLDLHLDADGDVMGFQSRPLSPQRVPKEPTLPQEPAASYEGSPADLVADGLPVELRPAWGDRLPVSMFVVQQAIGLLQPASVMTSVFERKNDEALVSFSGQRDGLTFWFVVPLNDVKVSQP